MGNSNSILIIDKKIDIKLYLTAASGSCTTT